ncbi:MAG: AMP-binding protein [Pseudomonadota bacterium]|uniref:AMP-binding protein n=1 Tax=Phenylobacterium sp. TaxID=1871053 RepID=UPI0025CF5BF3|nr:AMP-binding protein [Phenylobacterium sp.]MBT9469920.1 AMP-binding protein [Phenylobacterium sp.]
MPLSQSTVRAGPTARNVYDLILGPARSSPEAEALVFLPTARLEDDPVRLTRAAFASGVARAANLFRRLDIGHEDVVSILAPNLLDVQFAFWGAETAGVVNPVNYLLSIEHLSEILRAADSKVLVTVGPQTYPEIWAKALEVGRRTPSLKAIVTLGGEAPEGALAFSALMAGAGDAPPRPDEARAPGDRAAYFHTGGTTGAPKLVVHTHGNQVHAAQAAAESYGFNSQDTVMCGLPMFHVAGPILLTLAPLSAGARVIMPTPSGNRDPLLVKNYWRIAEHHNATLVGGVPTTLADILRRADGPPPAQDPRRICMAGGAQLAEGLQRGFETASGVAIHQVYGMTETAGVICAAPRSERPPPTSVGKPVSGVEVEIRHLAADGSPGLECAQGEVGAIFARGPNVTAGYHRSGGGLEPVGDAGGWFHTGDLGRFDAEGWLFVTGRSKDVIIRSGHNIDPAAIEEVARSHPEVADAAAVGCPDVRAGEVPVVFAVLRPGASVSADELKDFIIENVSEAPAKPASVILLPALPVTAIGKVFRPALRAEAVRAVVTERVNAAFPAQARPEVEIDQAHASGIWVLIRRGGAAEGPAWSDFLEWISQHTFEYRLDDSPGAGSPRPTT